MLLSEYQYALFLLFIYIQTNKILIEINDIVLKNFIFLLIDCNIMVLYTIKSYLYDIIIRGNNFETSKNIFK